ncbi:hypothetical protein ACHAXR_010516 [Thalassiosira sp. AJA248-18]
MSADEPIRTLTLEELLASKCLSKITLLFGHETAILPQHGASQLLPPPQGGHNNHKQKKKQYLNAAKVSLLLAKSIVAAREELKRKEKSYNATLRVDDFCVKLKLCSPKMMNNGLVNNHVNKTAINGGIRGRLDSNDEQWALLDVDMIPREKISIVESDEGHDDEQLAIHFLGKIIYAIFSNGSSQPLLPQPPIQSARVSVCSEEEGDTDAIGVERKKQTRRTDDNFLLFSALMGTGEYPASVCRLLSDMISDDCDNNHITSFDDVIEDLEQMSNNPEIFLYDQGNDFCTSTLHLGQGLSGRVEELTKLLEISNRIVEESAIPEAVSSLGTNRSPSPMGGNIVDAVFVSGAAGSGKSCFVQFAGNFLTNLGWMVHKVKFKRDVEHGSREIVSSLFEKLVAALVAMKRSNNVVDSDYSRRATTAISDALDPASLSSLANFIPSVQGLIPDIDKNASRPAEADMSHWQLVFLLSKLVGAILSLDRHIMFCLDDLQWCDSTTIGLISEMLISIGQRQHGSGMERQRLLAVGIYRDEEITESHPLTSQLFALQQSGNVHLTEIKLPSLSKDDVADMIMAETRLPRRLVVRLADVVYKKTSGHAMFVVELLNSLVRDSTIAYSPRKHRFDWDEHKIATLRTVDSVASLIVSNLSLLKPKPLQSLKILSCLGVQIPLSLVKLLDTSPCELQGGMESSLPSLVERGVLEISGPSIVFAHDLIQQHVYENISEEGRQKLHRDIGIFLGAKAALDASSKKLSIEGGVDNLDLSDGSSSDGSGQSNSIITRLALIFIATDQINAAGPQFIVDPEERARFAGWNLCAGREAAESSNFQAALHYNKNGIAFLTDVLFGDSTHQRCRELHEGAAFALFALGNATEVERYARAIIEHVSFEDSLVAQDLQIRSLKGAGKYAETIARGLAVLRLLKIAVPSASPMAVIESMRETSRITSQYSSDQITNMKQTSINARKRRILKIVDAVIVACYREASPYLPLVTCAMVNYSLQNGVCEESATAFVVYGYFRIFLEENFEEGRRWGDIALKILDSNSPFTPMTLYGFLLFWFIPHREVGGKLLGTCEAGMRAGDVDTAMYALCLSLRFLFFGGENLALLSRSYRKSLEQMGKYNQECLKYAIVDCLIIDGLTGKDSCPFRACEGMIQDEDVLLADAKYKSHNQGMEAIYTRRFFSAFWNGDYAEANKWVDTASSLPSSKMPKIQLIHHSFYRGLIAFQLYRDGEGEEWLDVGKKLLDKMELWVKNSKAIFESKLILLEAEHYASMCNIVAAKESYELSAQTARDHGLVHEQGLACELHGKFLSSISETMEASHWFQRAHTCYMQWGALSKAAQLQKDHNLFIPDGNNMSSSMKHERDENDVYI